MFDSEGLARDLAASPLPVVTGLGHEDDTTVADLVADWVDRTNPDAVKRVIAEANKRKLLLLSAGSYAQVIRIIPPLVTTAAEVDLAVKILDESLDAAGVKRT